MGTRTEEDLLDLEILDAVAGLFARLVAEGDDLAKRVGIPAFVIKALHMLDGPLAMKDLGRRMHCDPSFITGIADTLERHGLAARESDPGDRRVKRLVLTPAGAEMKRRVEDEILSRTPWRRGLSPEERASLLKLVHKMSQRQVLKEMEPHPLRHVRTLDVLPWQHIIIFTKMEAKK